MLYRHHYANYMAVRYHHCIMTRVVYNLQAWIIIHLTGKLSPFALMSPITMITVSFGDFYIAVVQKHKVVTTYLFKYAVTASSIALH